MKKKTSLIVFCIILAIIGVIRYLEIGNESVTKRIFAALGDCVLIVIETFVFSFVAAGLLTLSWWLLKKVEGFETKSELGPGEMFGDFWVGVVGIVFLAVSYMFLTRNPIVFNLLGDIEKAIESV